MEELRSYSDLKDNWDGEGAKAPSDSAIADTLVFLHNRPSDIPLPKPDQGRDGEAGLYWDFANVEVFVEATFEGDGTFTYFAVHGVPDNIKQKYGWDDVDIHDDWPDDMVKILRIPE